MTTSMQSAKKAYRRARGTSYLGGFKVTHGILFKSLFSCQEPAVAQHIESVQNDQRCYVFKPPCLFSAGD